MITREGAPQGWAGLLDVGNAYEENELKMIEQSRVDATKLIARWIRSLSMSVLGLPLTLC